jgi:hypothetical protein
MFIITLAGVADSVPAILLFWTAKALFGFAIRMVRADAAYWTAGILTLVLYGLRSWPAIDYNLCQLGKKFIASLEFLN